MVRLFPEPSLTPYYRFIADHAPSSGDVITRVGRYQVLEELAKGGMGRVFVAQKDGSADICVLKLLNTEYENDQAGAQRLRREAHLLALMNHPNISRVLDAGFEKGAFFLALEFIPGHTIAVIQQHLRKQRRRIPPEVTMAVALDVLSGLIYAHDHTDPDGNPIHLVHRDLSPNNIMLGYSGHAKIIDFGIASGRIDTFKTKPGHIMGTPRYLSPEQATLKTIDRRSDLYTLSVVLYGMFLGRPLIKKGAPGQVLAEIVDKPPRPLTEMIPDFPEETWRVLVRGLSKDPSKRYQTASEYREALESANPWTLPSREEIGLFLEEYFPEGKRTAEDLVARGRANAPSIVQPGGFFDTTGIDLPLPSKKAPVTEPEIEPDLPGGDTPTALIDRAADEAPDDGTKEIIPQAAMEQVGSMDTGPTVANDPLQPSGGFPEVPVEKKGFESTEKTNPSIEPPARHPWRPLVWLLLALMLGVGAGLVLNLLE